MRGTLLLVAALACSGEDECHRALPADDFGEPWPTFTELRNEVVYCTQPQGLDTRIGTCSDGKTFIDQGHGFTGQSNYFRGEELVGLRRWSDLINGCVDNESLGDSDCREVEAEDLGCP